MLKTLVRVFEPAPTSPPGVMTWLDLGKAVLATMVSSGLVYAALDLMARDAAASHNAVLAAAVAAVVKFLPLVLKLWSFGPPPAS